MLYIDLYNKSLRNVAQYLKLPCQKGDFDYTKPLSRRLSNDEYQELGYLS